MNKSNRTRVDGRPAATRRIFLLISTNTGRAALLLAAAGLASALPGPVAADATTSNEVLEEVTVTGIRASHR